MRRNAKQESGDAARLSPEQKQRNADLVSAVMRHDLPAVRELLESGADPEGRHPVGSSVLMTASKRGDVELLRLLLKHGADPDFADSNDDTAACLAKDLPTLDALIAGGSDIRSPVRAWRMIMRNEELAKARLSTAELKAARKIQDSRSLEYAIANGKLSEAEELVRKGARLELAPIDSYYGTNGVMEVVADAGLEVVQFLLKHKVDLKYRAPNGKGVASSCRNYDCLKLLLENGAPFDERDLAFLRHNLANPEQSEKYTKLLLAHGIWQEAIDREKLHNRDAELSRACYDGLLEKVKRLLAEGADINAPEKPGGYTPLLRASQRDHVELANYLLERGADHTYRADGGYTAFHTNRPEILESLQIVGAIPTPEDTLWLMNWFHGGDWIREYLASFPVSIQEWQDSLYHIYHRIMDSDDVNLYEDVLKPAVPTVRAALEIISFTARYADSPPREYYDDRLAHLDALSRVLDTLLMAFQPDPIEYSQEPSAWMRGRLSLAQYEAFVQACGLETFREERFHPVFHEIVFAGENGASRRSH